MAILDNMFVLDFLPEEYLNGGAKDSIAIFTAGWAMKFVPLLGRALKQMVVDGKSEYKLSEFSIERKGNSPDEIVLSPGPVQKPKEELKYGKFTVQQKGSSMHS